MSILVILLLVAAFDYTRNGHITAFAWVRDKLSGRSKGHRYKAPAMQARVDRARAHGDARKVERKAAREDARAARMKTAYERMRDFVSSAAETCGGDGSCDASAPSGRHWVRKGDSEDARLQQMIMSDWRRPVVIDMLRDTARRQTRHRVTDRLGLDDTKMPVAYEWLAAVAWFHLSDWHYDVRSSMNLVLDDSMMPVRCAPGGEGDVVVRYGDCIVLIEATLMNLDNQRRNEWEPAMRHAANLEAESGLPVYTVFLAPEIDANTANVWRAVSRVPYAARNGQEVQVRVLPMTSNELAGMLERGVTASSVVEVIRSVYAEDEGARKGFDGSWRDQAVGAV